MTRSNDDAHAQAQDPKQFNTCTIQRIKVIRHGTLNILTGEMKDTGREETVTEACNTPLFSDDERRIGICRSCRSGWEVKGNKFASREEKQRAWAAAGAQAQRDLAAGAEEARHV